MRGPPLQTSLMVRLQQGGKQAWTSGQRCLVTGPSVSAHGPCAAEEEMEPLRDEADVSGSQDMNI